eukprot:419467-Amphidinium_carterae.2
MGVGIEIGSVKIIEGVACEWTHKTVCNSVGGCYVVQWARLWTAKESRWPILLSVTLFRMTKAHCHRTILWLPSSCLASNTVIPLLRFLCHSWYILSSAMWYLRSLANAAVFASAPDGEATERQGPIIGGALLPDEETNALIVSEYLDAGAPADFLLELPEELPQGQ